MDKNFSKALLILLALVCGAIEPSKAQTASAQVTLANECFMFSRDGYLKTFWTNCTCSKKNANVDGYVQWYFSNGSLPQQTRYGDRARSVLLVRAPYWHAKQETYHCRIVSPTGQLGPALEYPMKFPYGPDSAKLYIVDTDTAYCPVLDRPIKLHCDIPGEAVYPVPKFNFRGTAGIYDSSYDAYLGDFIQEANVWRLERYYTPKRVGQHSLVCYAMNMEIGPHIHVTLNVEVNAPPPPPPLIINGQTFYGTSSTNIVTMPFMSLSNPRCEHQDYAGFTKTAINFDCQDTGSATTARAVVKCTCTAQYRKDCIVSSTTEVLVRFQ